MGGGAAGAGCCGAAASTVLGTLCNCDARRHVRHTACGYAHSHMVGRHRILSKGSSSQSNSRLQDDCIAQTEEGGM